MDLRSTDHRLYKFQHNLVDKAPGPVLSRFERTDDRVARCPVVFRSMPVLRLIAAADVTAGSTQPKMYPRVAGEEALLASRGVRAIGHHELAMPALVTHGSRSTEGE